MRSLLRRSLVVRGSLVSALPLLVPRVGADHQQLAGTLDNFAILANPLNA
jgi:hypothetical protein